MFAKNYESFDIDINIFETSVKKPNCRLGSKRISRLAGSVSLDFTVPFLLFITFVSTLNYICVLLWVVCSIFGLCKLYE